MILKMKRENGLGSLGNEFANIIYYSYSDSYSYIEPCGCAALLLISIIILLILFPARSGSPEGPTQATPL